jgi:hypothetical protein
VKRPLSQTVSARETATLTVLLVAALVWRLAVGVGSLGTPGVGADPESVLRLILGVMGLGFLFCGWVVFSKARSTASVLFALYGLGQGIHWGGPLLTSAATLQTAIWFLYFTVSMLGLSALLHFTLLFPRRWDIAARAGTRWFLYLPVGLAAGLGAAALLVPTPGTARETLQGAFFVLETAQVNLYWLLALVVVAVRFTRAGSAERQASGLTVMLAGMILAQLPYVVALLLQSLAPGIRLYGGLGTQPYALFFILQPLAFTFAILRRPAAAEGARSAVVS